MRVACSVFPQVEVEKNGVRASVAHFNSICTRFKEVFLTQVFSFWGGG